MNELLLGIALFLVIFLGLTSSVFAHGLGISQKTTIVSTIGLALGLIALLIFSVEPQNKSQ